MVKNIIIQIILVASCAALKNRNNKRVYPAGSQCYGNSGESGICMSRILCSQQQGTPIGLCGLLGTCCAVSRCTTRTSAKSIIFTNPTIPNGGLECDYNIDINNDNVCQMRIDFQAFSLSQPTTETSGYECHDDRLEITGQIQDVSVPILCGENTGQHLYVKVNSSLDVRSIRMNLQIVSRSNKPDLTAASWRIKVSQVECFNMQRNLKDTKSTSDRDEHLIAPFGCLQYYPDRSGTIESFNYNRGSGPYLANLYYSMCFRRVNSVCGIRLVISQFELAAIGMAGMDAECVSTTANTGDYLFIPEGESSDGTQAAKWCGTSAQNLIITVTPPGPLYVHFKSDDLLMTGINEFGFKFTYNTINNCV